MAEEACKQPLRLDAYDVMAVLECDRAKGHGGRHASYEHGCQVSGSIDGDGDRQCELPQGHRGPHRATGVTDETPWTFLWANPEPED